MPLRNIEYLINEFQQKMYLQSQRNVPNDVLLNVYLNSMKLLVSEQTIHMPKLSLKLISTICNVLKSNCSQATKNHYEETLKIFTNTDDYTERQVDWILCKIDPLGITLDLDSDESSSLSGSGTYDESITE
jgi:hypothetical protein